MSRVGSRKVSIGSRWGRWTVVRRAAPAQRYNEGYMRARVVVECVCGAEDTQHDSDLRSGKTKGCTSKRCWARWVGYQALQDTLRGVVEDPNGGPDAR